LDPSELDRGSPLPPDCKQFFQQRYLLVYLCMP
jgi:hypothetical protein